MRGLFFVMAVLSQSAIAGQAYKCKGADGSVVFSQTPCGKSAQPIELRQVQTVGDSPAVRELSDAKASKAKADSASPPPQVPQPQATVPESYRCVVPNGEVFYQHSQCPANVEVRTTTWVGNYPVTKTQYAPVEAVGVSRATACEAIRKPSKRAGSNRDESYSSYDRREHRDPCGT